MVQSTPAPTLVDKLLLYVSAAMLIVSAVVLFRVYQHSRPTEGKAPPTAIAAPVNQMLPALSVVGDNGVRSVVSLTGAPRLVYIFSTGCHFCELEHKHIASVFRDLPRGSVITASSEAPAVTHGYWDRSSGLDAPLSVEPHVFSDLGVTGTPALLFVAPSGRIASAFVGTSFGWGAKEMRSELDKVSLANDRHSARDSSHVRTAGFERGRQMGTPQ